MGLFDKLFRQGANAITKVATDAIESTMSKTSNVPTGYEGLEEEDVDRKLRAVLAKEFPQYEVREQVSPTTLGGTGKFKPYDFGIYENGAPKLFIMVVYNNTCAQREYRWSKEQAEAAGVTMINFVFAFENRLDYIIDRLHQFL
ncbi:MAG: hypothetical protein IJX63_01775 [Lachnospiraceae bacterium]|nr:hypothetical protein [Lachnospiraceae bacterium]